MSSCAGNTRKAGGLRLSVPSVEGPRAGLGNELFVWNKAWLSPSFDLNPRADGRYRIDLRNVQPDRSGRA